VKQLSLEKSKRIAHLFPNHKGLWWNILPLKIVYLSEKKGCLGKSFPAPDVYDLLELLPDLEVRKTKKIYEVGRYRRIEKTTLNLLDALGLMVENNEKDKLK
jgi:hypothetical protein